MKASAVGVLAGLIVLAGAAGLNTHRAAEDRAAQRLVVQPDPHPMTVDAGPSSTPAPSALGCGTWMGASVDLEAAVTLVTSKHPYESVLSWYCTDAAGMRHPSLVIVADADPDRGTTRTLAVLLRPQDGLHVQRISVSGTSITVTASYWGAAAPSVAPEWRRPGGVVSRRFSTIDGENFHRGPLVRLIPSCGKQDISVRLVPGGSRQGSSSLIQFTNSSHQTCAIEGYPSVVPRAGIAAVSKAWPTLRGPLGGVLHGLSPPIVVITPGGVATSMLEPSGTAVDASPGLCTQDRLAVGLPATGELTVFAGAMGWCNPEVHPVVSGPTGTTP
jgi:hypothetical protein